MAAGTTFQCQAFLGSSILALLLAGCVASNTGGTGGAGGQAATGGSGGSGTGGTGGAPGALPDYKNTNAAGKIASHAFTFATGFVSPGSGDATSMQVEMLGFSPELSSSPCWNKPPPGSNRDTELSVVFRVPKEGGSFEWGGGKTIAGYTTVTLLSVNADGTPKTFPSDRAKVTLGAMPSRSGDEVSGSIVIQADANNTINGTFRVRRCDR